MPRNTPLIRPKNRKEPRIAEYGRKDRREQHGEHDGDEGKAVIRAVIDGENAVGIAGNAEEGGLSEAQRAAIPPEQRQPQRHEDPGEEIGDIADRIAVGELRIDEAREHDDGE